MPRPKVQERRAQADSGAVHEHELAGDGDRPLFLQGLAHLEGLAAAIFAGRHIVGDGAHPVVQQGAVDEPRPDVQHIDQVVIEIGEAPAAIGLPLLGAVVVQQAAIEPHHPGDKARRKDADTAKVQQVQMRRAIAALGPAKGVVAQMRVAMNDPQLGHRGPPGLEQQGGDAVAGLLRRVLEGQQPLPLHPGHAQQSLGRQR